MTEAEPRHSTVRAFESDGVPARREAAARTVSLMFRSFHPAHDGAKRANPANLRRICAFIERLEAGEDMHGYLMRAEGAGISFCRLSEAGPGEMVVADGGLQFWFSSGGLAADPWAKIDLRAVLDCDELEGAGDPGPNRRIRTATREKRSAVAGGAARPSRASSWVARHGLISAVSCLLAVSAGYAMGRAGPAIPLLSSPAAAQPADRQTLLTVVSDGLPVPDVTFAERVRALETDCLAAVVATDRGDRSSLTRRAAAAVAKAQPGGSFCEGLIRHGVDRQPGGRRWRAAAAAANDALSAAPNGMQRPSTAYVPVLFSRPPSRSMLAAQAGAHQIYRVSTSPADGRFVALTGGEGAGLLFVESTTAQISLASTATVSQ